MEYSPSSKANSCSAIHSISCLSHNTHVHSYFHHSPTHALSPNFFIPPIFCSNTYSSLNNITIRAHMFSVRTHQHCSQTQSTVCSQSHIQCVTPTFMKIWDKHTCLAFNFHDIRMHKRQQSLMKLYRILLQINFFSTSWFCNLYSLMLLQNSSSSRPFQNFKQCIS